MADQTYHQMIHRDCAGSLVIVVSEAGEVAVSCDRCRKLWTINDPSNEEASMQPAEEWVRGTVCVPDVPLTILQ